jgi:hypothetical protein
MRCDIRAAHSTLGSGIALSSTNRRSGSGSNSTSSRSTRICSNRNGDASRTDTRHDKRRRDD